MDFTPAFVFDEQDRINAEAKARFQESFAAEKKTAGFKRAKYLILG
jgi:hypothetical protein